MHRFLIFPDWHRMFEFLIFPFLIQFCNCPWYFRIDTTCLTFWYLTFYFSTGIGKALFARSWGREFESRPSHFSFTTSDKGDLRTCQWTQPCAVFYMPIKVKLHWVLCLRVSAFAFCILHCELSFLECSILVWWIGHYLRTHAGCGECGRIVLNSPLTGFLPMSAAGTRYLMIHKHSRI